MADGNRDSGCPGLRPLSPGDAATPLQLRVLASTDLHMHVLGWNYLTDRPTARLGMARLAGLIARCRAEAPDALLLDNGDVLQGNPLGDFVAEASHGAGRGRGPIHPAIAAMNALRYDAGTLGNHDFGYGIGYLRRVLAQAAFPVVCANIVPRRGRALPPWVMLTRDLADEAGMRHRVRIAVIGLAPPQTVEWESGLRTAVTASGIVDTAARHVPAMRAAGADLVIALAHSGIGDASGAAGADNAATALAALEGIDVVIAGHTHQVFPGPRVAAAAGIDPRRGTLAGKPAVMAGYGGSHLGVIDLTLTRADAGDRDGAGRRWRIAAFSARAEPVSPETPPDRAVMAAAIDAHARTRRHLRRRVGRSARPLNSYFTLLGPDAGLRLVAMAQRWHVRQALRGTPAGALPVLSAVAPFRVGGRFGPDHYTDIPAGRLSLRSLADLYAFPNRVCALVMDGAGLRDWLERAAGAFAVIPEGAVDAPLLAPDFPGYSFDVIHGLHWRIDLRAPSRYDATGAPRPDGAAGRVRDLCHHGRPVAPGDRFVLATNSYRLSACGLYGPLAARAPLALQDTTLTRDVLRDYLRRRRRVDPGGDPPWRFVPLPGTTALFQTGPRALAHLPLAGDTVPRVEPAGLSERGFAVLRVHL